MSEIRGIMVGIFRKIFFPLFIVCIGLLAGACNDEDDIDIFVGRTWKVSNFFGPAGAVYTKVEDLKTLEKENAFYIKFEDASTFTGRTLDKEFKGTWSVDLVMRRISFRLNGSVSPSDAISKQMIKSIKESVSYRGDYKWLNLVDKEGAYILFHPIVDPIPATSVAKSSSDGGRAGGGSVEGD